MIACNTVISSNCLHSIEVFIKQSQFLLFRGPYLPFYISLRITTLQYFYLQ